MQKSTLSSVRHDPTGSSTLFVEDTWRDRRVSTTHDSAWLMLLAELAALSPDSPLLVTCAAPTHDGDAGLVLRALLARKGVYYLPETACDLSQEGYINLEMMAEYTLEEAQKLDWRSIRELSWMVRVIPATGRTPGSRRTPDWTLVQGWQIGCPRYIESDRNDESLYAYGFGERAAALSQLINDTLGKSV